MIILMNTYGSYRELIYTQLFSNEAGKRLIIIHVELLASKDGFMTQLFIIYKIQVVML